MDVDNMEEKIKTLETINSIYEQALNDQGEHVKKLQEQITHLEKLLIDSNIPTIGKD